MNITLESSPLPISGKDSLKKRLMKLAFLPLLVSFPVVLAVLGVFGGSLYDARLEAVVRSNLSTVQSFLNHHRIHTEIFVAQLLKSETLRQLLIEQDFPGQLNNALASRAANMRLDFLFIVDRQGAVIASSTGINPPDRLSNNFVVRQAISGVLTSGLESMAARQLKALVPGLSPRIDGGVPIDMLTPPSALLLLAAGPFPLSNDYPDSVLCGGILLNNDHVLIDHVRDITFPITPETEHINGIVTLFAGDAPIVTSIEGAEGNAAVGTREPRVAQEVVGMGKDIVQQMTLMNKNYLSAFSPIISTEGKPIGMMSVGIPSAKYRNEKWLVIGSIAALLILSMLGAAVIFQRGTHNIVSRLEKTIDTMKATQTGLSDKRIEIESTRDEITLLGVQFNDLLDALQAGEEAKAMARQDTANEAARRRALFDHERDGLVVLNGDGTIFEANQSFLTMLGYEASDLSDLHIWDWDKGYNRIQQGQLQCMFQEGERYREVQYQRKDGSLFVAEVSTSRITWNDQTSYLFSVRDTTEFRELQRQLMQSQKLESLGQIAAGIAHEINSPMQFVLSNVTFIEEAFTEIQTILEELENYHQSNQEELAAILAKIDIKYLREEIPLGFKDIHDGIERVIKIIVAMKEFSHPGSSSPILTDINHILDNTLIVCRNEWKYDAEMITKFDPDLPKMLCFPDQLNQVILNLIINACHAIQTRKETSPEPPGAITISTSKKEQWIEIQVADNGCGIPEHIRHRIFDPFFTTKTVGKGTGQGLAIVHDIVVNKHGGVLHCSSTEGIGTVFTIQLPFPVIEEVA